MYTFKLRRGYFNYWTTKNPILNEGEPGFEINTNKFKIGDGIHHWNDLPYFDSAGNSPLAFVWDGSAYQPSEFLTDMTHQKWFTGPVHPATAGATLAQYDQWIDTS
jgi:hypothetical protein